MRSGPKDEMHALTRSEYDRYNESESFIEDNNKALINNKYRHVLCNFKNWFNRRFYRRDKVINEHSDIITLTITMSTITTIIIMRIMKQNLISWAEF